MIVCLNVRLNFICFFAICRCLLLCAPPQHLLSGWETGSHTCQDRCCMNHPTPSCIGIHQVKIYRQQQKYHQTLPNTPILAQTRGWRPKVCPILNRILLSRFNFNVNQKKQKTWLCFSSSDISPNSFIKTHLKIQLAGYQEKYHLKRSAVWLQLIWNGSIMSSS